MATTFPSSSIPRTGVAAAVPSVAVAFAPAATASIALANALLKIIDQIDSIFNLVLLKDRRFSRLNMVFSSMI